MSDEEIELSLDDDEDELLDTNQQNTSAVENESSMNPLQLRLFKARMKLNEARKSNHNEVLEENKRKRVDKKAEAARKRRLWLAKQKELEADAKKRGLQPERAKLLNMTAWQAEKSAKKKKSGGFGWDQYNDEASFAAHKKQLAKSLPKRTAEEDDNSDINDNNNNNNNDSDDDDDVKRSALSAEGLIRHVPSEKAVDRLVDSLNARSKRKFSRHRVEDPDANVDYINERNKAFNKKIARAFDGYTEEIRENLERGTAI